MAEQKSGVSRRSFLTSGAQAIIWGAVSGVVAGGILAAYERLDKGDSKTPAALNELKEANKALRDDIENLKLEQKNRRLSDSWGFPGIKSYRYPDNKELPDLAPILAALKSYGTIEENLDVIPGMLQLNNHINSRLYGLSFPEHAAKNLYPYPIEVFATRKLQGEEMDIFRDDESQLYLIRSSPTRKIVNFFLGSIHESLHSVWGNSHVQIAALELQHAAALSAWYPEFVFSDDDITPISITLNNLIEGQAGFYKEIKKLIMDKKDPDLVKRELIKTNGFDRAIATGFLRYLDGSSLDDVIKTNFSTPNSKDARVEMEKSVDFVASPGSDLEAMLKGVELLNTAWQYIGKLNPDFAA